MTANPRPHTSAQLAAILWCQWRTLRNFHGSGRAKGVAVTIVISVVWYSVWAAIALGVGFLCSGTMTPEHLGRVLPAGLLLSFLYWQIFPVMMASSGAHLDIRKLLVYPLEPQGLFFLEAALRVTTAIEMLGVTPVVKTDTQPNNKAGQPRS